MRKGSLVIFGIFAAIMVIAVPIWATNKEGSEDASPVRVAGASDEARTIFSENCGPCHTLEAAGTAGVVGPNLDESPAAASAESVLGFIENGAAGRMPAGLLRGERAQIVAEYVAEVAGQ